MMETIAELWGLFVAALVGVLNEAAPWLLIGLIVAGLLKAFVPMGMMSRWLGGRGLKPVLRAAVVGTPLPLCSCSVLPAAIALRRGGASKGATASFLVSTPENGVDSIALTYALLGPVMTIARPVAAMFSAIGAGVLVNAAEKAEEKKAAALAESPEGFDEPAPGDVRIGAGTVQMPAGVEPVKACCSHDHDAEMSAGAPTAKQPFVTKLKSGVGFAFGDILKDIALWLLVGLVLAAVIQAFVPAELIKQWGSGPLAMVVMLLIGLPMYICATASTPVAAGLLFAGVSPGAVLVFLLAGPATNFASVLVLRKELGTKPVAMYLAAVAGGALVSGLVLDVVISAASLQIDYRGGSGGHFMPAWVGPASLALFGLALVRNELPQLKSSLLGNKISAGACCSSGCGCGADDTDQVEHDEPVVQLAVSAVQEPEREAEESSCGASCGCSSKNN